MHSVLENINEGMKVYDRMQHEIGTVECVKLVDVDEIGQPVAEDVSAEERGKPHSLINDIAEAFRSDDLPEVVQERLLQEGFVRMDAEGLFNADRYVMPDQIQSVSGDRVTLKVTKDELIKRH